MDFETLIAEVSAGVATIWLNRPEQRNAFNATMSDELDRAFATFEAADDVRAIVVTGSGRYFSVGADLESGGDTFAGPQTPEQLAEEKRIRSERIRPWRMRTPIIAAMNGSAVGMGLTFPMNWDVRFVAEDAKYGFVFNRRGIIAEANSLWMSAHVFGLSRTFDLLLSGRIFTGREAEQRGLATAALPVDDVLPAALELAHDIATNTSAVSVAITKRLVYRALDGQTRDEADDVLWDTFRWMGRSPDASEGVAAFVERREPEWKMSKTRDFPEGL